MPNITAMFWDLGGVLLTNAWDHTERCAAVMQFGLDPTDFENRHKRVVAAFERGELSLDQYLDETIFYTDRPFSREVFRQFMFSRSQPNPEALALARQLRASTRYFMATINNESTELNLYRIQQFHLREIFDLFVSSCFVHLRKPDSAIYRLALNLTQRVPGECCLIDDRPENLVPARQLGMHTIQMQGVDALREELKRLGIQVDRRA